MIVLGIDPSYRATGIAVVSWQPTNGRYIAGTEQVQATGVVSAPKRGDSDEAYRRKHIADACTAWAHTHHVDLVAVEEPCRGLNAATDAMLQRLSATITDRLSADGHEWTLVNNRKRLRALGIHGNDSAALKRAARRAVLTRYGIDVTADEADAIGHALAGVRQWLDAQRPAPEQLRLAMSGGRRAKRQ
jgi:Holliday junction resolvasome RuvABC endonuclease subunit